VERCGGCVECERVLWRNPFGLSTDCANTWHRQLRYRQLRWHADVERGVRTLSMNVVSNSPRIQNDIQIEKTAIVIITARVQIKIQIPFFSGVFISLL
ncbi:unnamed protein product, partial [Pylaiella littoralis]